LSDERQWRPCSVCKKPIRYRATYWTCSVSTCNRKRTGLAFCSVSCWDAHVPGAGHREAWAVEETAPSREEAARQSAEAEARAARQASAEPRAVSSPPSRAEAVAPTLQPAPSEVLIVASRLKDYVRARSGFNTSDGVLGPLSDIVRRVMDRAIQNAGRDGRKTVLDRDIPGEL
jgi:hypothetical protein